jgi:hypothetical protein
MDCAALLLWLMARVIRLAILASGAALKPARVLRVLFGRFN